MPTLAESQSDSFLLAEYEFGRRQLNPTVKGRFSRETGEAEPWPKACRKAVQQIRRSGLSDLQVFLGKLRRFIMLPTDFESYGLNMTLDHAVRFQEQLDKRMEADMKDAELDSSGNESPRSTAGSSSKYVVES